MEFSIAHQIYAATRRNGGFGVFFQSPRLSQLDDSNKEIIKKNSTYSAPYAITNSESLSLYPVNYAYYTIEDNGTTKSVLLFSKYTGATNHTPDRPGNFLSHTVLFDVFLGGLCVPTILKHFSFRDSLTIEEEDTFVEPSNLLEFEQPDITISIRESLVFLLADNKYKNTLLAIVDEIMTGWLNTIGHNITIFAKTNQDCVNIIYALFTLIPAKVINHFSFATYVSHPSKVSYQICGIIPECQVKELDPDYFRLYDVETYTEDYTPKWEFTRLLKTWLERQDSEKIGGLGQLFDVYNIELLDEKVEMPFKIELFKETISTKQLSDLNDILRLFPSSLSTPKNDLIKYIRSHNFNLYLSYQVQEMRKEVKTNHSITGCINIIERYIKSLSTELDDEQLLFIYKEFEQTVSHLARPGKIAAELLTSDYDDIKEICLNNVYLNDYLFNCVEINWDEINNKEAFWREYEETLTDNNFPRINLWIEKQTLENDIKKGTLFDNIDKHKGALAKLQEKGLIETFSRTLEQKNQMGELSSSFLERAISHINSHFHDPSVFWNNYFMNEIEKGEKDYRLPYSSKWSYSLIKRCLIVYIAVSDIHHISKYESLYNEFDEYECRWVLERLTEMHNREGYNRLLSLLPREKKKFFGFL